MKTSRYLILITFVLVLVVPMARLYTINPDVNACMVEYVDSFDSNNGSGFIYKIDGLNHIEAKSSTFNKSIVEHRVGYSEGCIMASGDLFTDFNNSVYCSQTYMTKKAINHYTDDHELSLLERVKLFRSRKTTFFNTLKNDLILAKDTLLEVYTIGFRDMFYSLNNIGDDLINASGELIEVLEEI